MSRHTGEVTDGETTSFPGSTSFIFFESFFQQILWLYYFRTILSLKVKILNILIIDAVRGHEFCRHMEQLKCV